MNHLSTFPFAFPGFNSSASQRRNEDHEMEKAGISIPPLIHASNIDNFIQVPPTPPIHRSHALLQGLTGNAAAITSTGNTFQDPLDLNRAQAQPPQALAPLASSSTTTSRALVLHNSAQHDPKGKKRQLLSSRSNSDDGKSAPKVRLISVGSREARFKRQEAMLFSLNTTVLKLGANLEEANQRTQKLAVDLREADERIRVAETRAASAEGNAIRKVAELQAALDKATSVPRSGYISCEQEDHPVAHPVQRLTQPIEHSMQTLAESSIPPPVQHSMQPPVRHPMQPPIPQPVQPQVQPPMQPSIPQPVQPQVPPPMQPPIPQPVHAQGQSAVSIGRAPSNDQYDSSESEETMEEQAASKRWPNQSFRRRGRSKNPSGRRQMSNDDRSDESPTPTREIPSPRRFAPRRGGGGPRLQLAQTSTAEKDYHHDPLDHSRVSEESGSGNAHRGASQDFFLKTLATLDRTATQLASVSEALERVTKNTDRGTRLSRVARKNRVFKPPPLRDVTKERTELLAMVRTHMNLLLHIESDRDILTSPARREDSKAIQAFEDDESESALEPQLNPLRPSWSNPRGAWNRALAYRFTQYMVRHAGSPAYLTAEVKGAFMGRLERLRRLIKEHEPREGETAEGLKHRLERRQLQTAKRDRINSRRSNLYDIRLLIAHEDRDEECERAAWEKIRVCVETLGPGGMSSDDSNAEDSIRTPRKMPWRSPEMLRLLMIVDGDANRRGLFGAARPGNPGKPRKRRAVAGDSRRTAIPGLPINFYNETWFASLRNRDRAELEVKETLEIPIFDHINGV